ncbi:hypothetical protein APZ41_005260 [Roseomonas mucosa]|uniref:Uncharacterized protein n=1 Tax=Roseomonas mucosa TaxID=207340 RepID=A0A1S8D924_9PROT|nr:hypothetical protein APZ41_005260 [Roseomonas mucosa]
MRLTRGTVTGIRLLFCALFALGLLPLVHAAPAQSSARPRPQLSRMAHSDHGDDGTAHRAGCDRSGAVGSPATPDGGPAPFKAVGCCIAGQCAIPISVTSPSQAPASVTVLAEPFPALATAPVVGLNPGPTLPPPRLPA